MKVENAKYFEASVSETNNNGFVLQKNIQLICGHG